MINSEYQRGLEAHERAVEHGRYLADAAERFMKEVNKFNMKRDSEGIDVADIDLLTDHWKALDARIHDFRKRAAAIRGLTPQPRKVILRKIVHGDFPFGHMTYAEPGTYDAVLNPQGAVSIVAQDGTLLGLKPGEFEWVEGGLTPQPEMCPNCESTVKKDVYFVCRETPHAWHVEDSVEVPQPAKSGIASAIMASPAFKAGQAATRKMLDWESATPPTPQPTILMCSCGSEFKPQCPDCKKLHGRAGVPVEPMPTHPVGMQVALKSLLLMCRAVHKTYAESNSESELPGANGRTFDENIRHAGQVLNDFYSSALAGVEQPTPKEAKS